LNAAPASQCADAAAPCTSAQVAAQDLSEWATTLVAVLPGLTGAVITCQFDATAVNPVTCSIQLAWNENVVGLNTATSATATAAQNQTALSAASQTQTQYILYVQP
jgi:hypothetical protein